MHHVHFHATPSSTLNLHIERNWLVIAAEMKPKDSSDRHSQRMWGSIAPRTKLSRWGTYRWLWRGVKCLCRGLEAKIAFEPISASSRMFPLIWRDCLSSPRSHNWPFVWLQFDHLCPFLGKLCAAYCSLFPRPHHWCEKTMEFQARRSHFLHFPHVAKVALPVCRAVVMQTCEHTHRHAQTPILTFTMPGASELS